MQTVIDSEQRKTLHDYIGEFGTDYTKLLEDFSDANPLLLGDSDYESEKTKSYTADKVLAELSKLGYNWFSQNCTEALYEYEMSKPNDDEITDEQKRDLIVIKNAKELGMKTEINIWYPKEEYNYGTGYDDDGKEIFWIDYQYLANSLEKKTNRSKIVYFGSGMMVANKKIYSLPEKEKPNFPNKKLEIPVGFNLRKRSIDSKSIIIITPELFREYFGNHDFDGTAFKISDTIGKIPYQKTTSNVVERTFDYYDAIIITD
jgi:hypothetical protein